MDKNPLRPYTLVLQTCSMDTRDSNQSAEYWNAVADLQPPEVRCQAWRRYADRLNADLVRRFLPAAEPFRRALKTDLFDETLGEGLTPLLTGLAENIAGIDISLAIARGAAENADVILPVNASVTDPPFREGSFDLIVSNSTLDHSPARKRSGNRCEPLPGSCDRADT